MDLSNQRFPQDRGHKLPNKIDIEKRARIFSMITNVDQNVGRLFKKLKDLNLTPKTIVIFMIDNGPNTRRYVVGLRGKKCEVYEGGIRSPFFMHWPPFLEPGRISDRVVAHIDVLPTLLDACGIPKPDELRLDGRSFLPQLIGEKTVWPDRTIVIQAHRGDRPVKFHNFAARSQRWKLLHASGFGKESFEGKPRFELYDMLNDPLETKDLADNHPDMVEKMVKEYEAWFKDVSHTRPDNYTPPRIHIGTPHENPVVLTRQDWRHKKGKPWGSDSNGYWSLYVAATGSYQIRLRFPAAVVPTKALLKISNQTLSGAVDQGALEYTFKKVQLHRGRTTLEAVLTSGEVNRGPMQVDVTWCPEK
jgi:arylsulfatase/arylsulfatase A